MCFCLNYAFTYASLCNIGYFLKRTPENDYFIYYFAFINVFILGIYKSPNSSQMWDSILESSDYLNA